MNHAPSTQPFAKPTPAGLRLLSFLLCLVLATSPVAMAQQFTLTYGAGTGGTIQTSYPQGLYDSGTFMTFLAVPDAGYTFDEWSTTGILVQSWLPQIGFAITANTTLAARFDGNPAPTPAPATHWLGQSNSTWSGTNWASDAAGNATTAIPTSTSNITFSAAGAQNQTPITLDVDATIKSLTVNTTASITGNNTLTSGYVIIGDGSSDTGNLTITGPVTVTTTSGNHRETQSTHPRFPGLIYDATGLSVGYQGNGTLNILAGAKLNTTSVNLPPAGAFPAPLAENAAIGQKVGSTGTVNVDGSGSSWTLDKGDVAVGYDGKGTLNITGGATVTVAEGDLDVGYEDTGSGTVTVAGAGSKLEVLGESREIVVGYDGSGVLDVKNGGVVSGSELYIAYDEETTGNVTVSGAGSQINLDEDGYISIGADGTGILNIITGGVVTLAGDDIDLGDDDGSGTLVVDGAGSKLSHTGNGDFYVGQDGKGLVEIKHGGVVTTAADEFYIAYDEESTGNVTVSGSGSNLTHTGEDYFDIANYGTGVLNVTNGGVVTTEADEFYIGYEVSGNGTVVVSGAGSKLTHTGGDLFHIGDYGKGLLSVTTGGVVTTSADEFYLGREFYDEAGLGTVTVDGAGSSLTHTGTGDFVVGGAGIGLLEVTNGGVVTTSNGILGASEGGIGNATVSGAGSKWTMKGDLSVDTGGTGILNILNGGEVSNANGFIATGPTANLIGMVTVSGDGSKWTNNGTLTVGDTGPGTLNIQYGGLVTVGNASGVSSVIGAQVGSNGTVTVNGGSWTNSAGLYVGNAGNGTLEISGNGSVSSKLGVIASFAGSTGLAKVSGGTWSNTDELYVGNYGNGTLEISGTSTVSSAVSAIANFAGSQGVAKVSGGNWTNSAELHVGNAGNGTLEISGNGAVSSKTGTIANLSGSTGLAKILAGSWAMTDDFFVGNSGNGTLEISGNGSVSSARSAIGNDVAANGLAKISGGTWMNSAALEVGNAGNGTLEISGNGSVSSGSGSIANLAGSKGMAKVTGGSWTNTEELYVGNGGNGTLEISGTGSVSNKLGVIASFAGATGLAKVSGGTWTNSETLYVGNYGNGTLEVSGNGSVSSGVSAIANFAGSRGIAKITSGNWTNSAELHVGNAGNGTMEISGSGSVTSKIGTVANISGSTGLAKISAGSWTNTNELYVGNFGNGTLELSGSGRVSSTDAAIANDAASTGVVRVTGGNWTNTRNLAVGVQGNGTLRISGTGSVSSGNAFIGASSGSRGLVTVTGGTWTNNGSLDVGLSGNGTLNIQNGGTVNVAGGNGIVTLGTNAGGNGILNMGIFGGSNSTAGTLAASEVRGGNGTAVLNFNQTSNATFAPIISGSTAVNQLGNATTTLIGNSTYTGITTIQSGTLNFVGDTSQLTGNFVNNSVLKFTQTANSEISGVISGSGKVNQSGSNRLVVSGNNTYAGGTTINTGVVQTENASALGSGPLTINGGALRATGTLNVGSLDWNAGTIALAPVAGDVINVAGAFTSGEGGGGLFSLAPEGLLVNQAYTLVSFASTNFSLGQFSVLWADPGVQYNSAFLLNGDSVKIVITGAEASGDMLHNTQGGVPTYADFTTIGNVVSGLTETGFQELQTFVNNLFVPNSSLLVPTPNILTVAGFMEMANSLLTVAGRLNVLGNFTDPNSTINVTGTMNVGGNAVIDGNSTMTVNGRLAVGGSASFDNNSLLTINTGGVVTVGSTTGINTGSQATINGQLTSPQVNVNGSSLLTGSGLIAGNVLNSGTVAPGNSPGTLTITGDYNQTSAGNLIIEIASQTVFDRLVVGGNANLGGTLQVLSLGFEFAYGQQFPVLQAGSITGQFASMTTSDPSNFRVRFLQNGGTGTLLIAPTSYTLVAQTQNQRNVAKALDSFIPATSGDRLVVSTALDLQSAEQYPAAFDAISPAQYENLTSTSIEQSNALSQILQQRFSSVRLTGARGFTQQGLKSPIVSDSGKSYVGKNVREGKDILTPAPDNNWGAWVQGDGFFGDFTSLATVPNSRFTSGGVTAGLDYRFPVGVTVGLFSGYSGLYSKYANGGTMNINTVNFGLYAAYEYEGGFYANLIVAGGYSGYQVKRSVEFSTIDRAAKSDPSGGLFSTTLDLGYDWEVGGFTITPTLAGQFTYVGIAPFTESGADSLDLRVDDQAATSLRTSLGARVAYPIKISESIAFIPQVSLLWQHEFLQNSRNIGAALDGGAGPAFDYTTSTPSRDAAYAGAGFTLRVGESLSFNANYNVNFGREDFFSNMVSGGLNISF